jgi:hypothetical protein
MAGRIVDEGIIDGPPNGIGTAGVGVLAAPFSVRPGQDFAIQVPPYPRRQSGT